MENYNNLLLQRVVVEAGGQRFETYRLTLTGARADELRVSQHFRREMAVQSQKALFLDLSPKLVASLLDDLRKPVGAEASHVWSQLLRDYNQRIEDALCDAPSLVLRPLERSLKAQLQQAIAEHTRPQTEERKLKQERLLQDNRDFFKDLVKEIQNCWLEELASLPGELARHAEAERNYRGPPRKPNRQMVDLATRQKEFKVTMAELPSASRFAELWSQGLTVRLLVQALSENGIGVQFTVRSGQNGSWNATITFPL